MQNSFFLFPTGSKEECEKAQVLLEKGNASDKKQWSSAETELSDDASSDDSIISDDVRYFHLIRISISSRLHLVGKQR